MEIVLLLLPMMAAYALFIVAAHLCDVLHSVGTCINDAYCSTHSISVFIKLNGTHR